MAGPGIYSNEEGFRKASGRLQTGKRRQLPAKDSGGLPQLSGEHVLAILPSAAPFRVGLSFASKSMDDPLAAQPGFFG